MPGAVLRASGSRVGVERFLKTTPWKPSAVFWKGQPRTPSSRRRCAINGFNVVVSVASGLEFPLQVREALRFLRKYEREFRRLRHLRLRAGLDFGVRMRDRDRLTFYRITSPLIERLDRYGLELEVSCYGAAVNGS
jgi:hypothetical protein